MSPGVPDLDVARRHLAAMDRAVAQLRKHAGRSEAELRGNLDALWVVERGLQLCAQNVIDLATHIATSRGLDVPDYASSIDALGAAGILEPAFAAQFRAVAGLRNVLVHGYLEVDVARLHQILQQRLDDFTVFATALRSHLGL